MPDVKHLSGTKFQGWLLGHELGTGADGVVYAATQDGVERAIKIFLPESLKKNGLQQARERLELQLSLVGQKPHPSLVTVYAGGEDEALGTLFLIMELVPGKSLDKILDVLPSEAIPGLVAQLADAAEYLEQQEMYHRDIKPANVVISDDYKKLTLLDLGIVYHADADDGYGRLSGAEFVATLRYSPPEFVWRTEQSKEAGAWQAVTFYQMGATVHDMITRRPLFDGMDQPRARLYDCVRDHTPKISAEGAPRWLIQLTEACLLKDWRQRLEFVRWERFRGPQFGASTLAQEQAIRLRQLRAEEMRQAESKRAAAKTGPNREQDLWHLNSNLFMEVRTYMIDSPIFPKFRSAEQAVSEQHYATEYTFDKDAARGFSSEVIVRIELKVAAMLDAATQLIFDAHKDGESIASATWTEMLTVETAFSLCKQALLDSVEQLIPRE